MIEPTPPSGGFLNSQLDVSRTALRTIGYVDDQISRGLVYNYSSTIVAAAGVPVYFMLEVVQDPEDLLAAIAFYPADITPVGGYAFMYIYEGTDYTGGTEQPTVQRNRVLYNQGLVGDSKAHLYFGPTGTDKGDLLYTYTFGTDARANGSGGGGVGDTINAVLFDASKKYLFELVASEDTTVGIVGQIGEIKLSGLNV